LCAGTALRACRPRLTVPVAVDCGLQLALVHLRAPLDPEPSSLAIELVSCDIATSWHRCASLRVRSAIALPRSNDRQTRTAGSERLRRRSGSSSCPGGTNDHRRAHKALTPLILRAYGQWGRERESDQRGFGTRCLLPARRPLGAQLVRERRCERAQTCWQRSPAGWELEQPSSGCARISQNSGRTMPAAGRCRLSRQLPGLACDDRGTGARLPTSLCDAAVACAGPARRPHNQTPAAPLPQPRSRS
jgi:hypothetical protein